MDTFTLSIRGEANVQVLADEAVVTVNVSAEGIDKSVARDKAEKLINAVEQYIVQFQATPQQLAGDAADAKDEASKPKNAQIHDSADTDNDDYGSNVDDDRCIDYEDDDDCCVSEEEDEDDDNGDDEDDDDDDDEEYEVVTHNPPAKGKHGFDLVGPTSPKAPRKTVIERPGITADIKDAPISRYTKHRTTVYSPGPVKPYDIFPDMGNLNIRDAAEADRKEVGRKVEKPDEKRDAKHKKKRRSIEPPAPYATGVLEVTFVTLARLQEFQQGITKLDDNCVISMVTYSLGVKSQKKCEATLRRAAMKHALKQARDYCYGMSCKPKSTTISPVKVVAKLDPENDPYDLTMNGHYSYDHRFDGFHYPPTRDIWSTKVLKHGAWHLFQDSAQKQFDRKLHLEVDFEIRTNKIFLAKTSKAPPSKDYKKKDKKVPAYVDFAYQNQYAPGPMMYHYDRV